MRTAGWGRPGEDGAGPGQLGEDGLCRVLGEEGWVRTAEQGQLGRVRMGLGEDGAGRGRLGEDGCMRTGEDGTAREDGWVKTAG